MSKRLGNAVDPFKTLEQYGADATRWYMISNASPWDNLKFNLEGLAEVSVFGTGPVGLCTAILVQKQGATVNLCQLVADDDERSAIRFCERYNTEVTWVSAQTNDEKDKVVQDAEVIICAARAGVRILESSLAKAKKLVLVADTNAVPPSGVAGIGLNDLGVEVEVAGTRFLSIGPMAIGNLKYKTEFGLFEQIQTSKKAALIDFPQAYEFALSVLEQQSIKSEKAA